MSNTNNFLWFTDDFKETVKSLETSGVPVTRYVLDTIKSGTRILR